MSKLIDYRLPVPEFKYLEKPVFDEVIVNAVLATQVTSIVILFVSWIGWD